MKIEAYIADCEDCGFLEDLRRVGVEPDVHHKYYYSTGAEHPGIWLVVTFAASSIAGGFIHDAFKLAVSRFLAFAKRQLSSSRNVLADESPHHACLVVRDQNMEIEIALGDSEVEFQWIESVTRKCAAISALFDLEASNCKVILPVEPHRNHWEYSRCLKESGYRYWMLYWKYVEQVVFDDQEKCFHRNASA